MVATVETILGSMTAGTSFRRRASISSAASVVNFTDQRPMITDQQSGNSDVLFIDHCSLAIARRIVSLCRRGEYRLLFLDHCSLTIEDAIDPTGLYEGGSAFTQGTGSYGSGNAFTGSSPVSLTASQVNADNQAINNATAGSWSTVPLGSGGYTGQATASDFWNMGSASSGTGAITAPTSNGGSSGFGGSGSYGSGNNSIAFNLGSGGSSQRLSSLASSVYAPVGSGPMPGFSNFPTAASSAAYMQNLSQRYAPSAFGSIVPRIFGGMQLAGGAIEAAFGLGVGGLGTATEAGSLGATTPVSVPAMVAGTLFAVNGADNMSAGLKSLWNGQPAETYTQQAITSATSSPTAGLWGNMVIGMAGGNESGLFGSAADVGVGSGNAYSVAFQTTLPRIGIPLANRAAHFQMANGALLDAMDADPVIAAQVRQLVPGVDKLRGPLGGVSFQPPTGWTWNHAMDQPGVMQLVPRIQHTPGSAAWWLMHEYPSGTGGFAQWGQKY